jgi:hypothetical protein
MVVVFLSTILASRHWNGRTQGPPKYCEPRQG